MDRLLSVTTGRSGLSALLRQGQLWVDCCHWLFPVLALPKFRNSFENRQLGWAPFDRLTWLIEQLLVVAALVAVAFVQRRIELSASASLQLCGFLVLHQIGAHYTYPQVPYDEAWQALTGFRLDEALGLRRNHYDRLVHFAYGLLLARPVREVVQGLSGLRG